MKVTVTKPCHKCGKYRLLNPHGYCAECEGIRMEEVSKLNHVNERYLECTRCRKLKPKDEFGSDVGAKGRGGKSYWCKQCHSEHAKEKREEKAGIPKTKICKGSRTRKGCGNEKPLNYFPPDKRSKDGRANLCTQCMYNMEKWPDVPEGSKFCIDCKKIKKESRFHIGSPYCKTCRKKHFKERQEQGASLNETIFQQAEPEITAEDVLMKIKKKKEEEMPINMNVISPDDRYKALMKLVNIAFFPGAEKVVFVDNENAIVGVYASKDEMVPDLTSDFTLEYGATSSKELREGEVKYTIWVFIPKE